MNRPRYYYLDLNHWIYLARAFFDRLDGQPYRETLDSALRAVADGRACFPVSASHIVETAKDGNADRRRRLAKFMVRLSGCTTIAAQEPFRKHELRRAILRLFDCDLPPISQPVFGRGPLFAFGHKRQPRSDHPRDRLVAELAENYSSSEAGMTELIAIPNEDYRLAGARRVKECASEFSVKEDSQRALLYGEPIDMRRRAYLARIILTESAFVSQTLAKIGKSFSDLEKLGPAKASSFIDYCPMLHVETELVLARNELKDRPVEANDSQDIGHGCMGIVYCDALVTENLWSHLAHKTGIATKYRCSVYHDVRSLVEHLADGASEGKNGKCVGAV